MKADDIATALGDVGKKWTRQIKSEERSPGTRRYRESMYTVSRTSLKDICWAHMHEAWMKASGEGRLPTHWRQMFYVMRPIVDAHPESDRELRDATFKNILEEYLESESPGWDILRGARGVFKEPHRAEDDNGLAMSTMNVRNYLGSGQPSARIETVPERFPTQGARNRIAALLICEKEGFDELLEAEHIPERFDLALMSTKGISALAARHLAERLRAPCFTLHDLDKNGFVMSSGFPFATDLGLHLDDVEELGLESEPQVHDNPEKTAGNLRANGATDAEAEFIANGERVELNVLTGPDFVEFVESKLREHGVEKVVPDAETLEAAWKRAHVAQRVNGLIETTWEDLERGRKHLEAKGEQPSRTTATTDLTAEIPAMPDDLADEIRDQFECDDTQSWDEALWSLVADHENGA